MPKADVATTTRVAPEVNWSCTASRLPRPSPAWYASAGNPSAAQRLGQPSRLGAGGAVDQPAPVAFRGQLGRTLHHLGAPLVLVAVQQGRQVQVRAVERRDHLDGIVQAEAAQHVGAHRRRGRRGQRHHRRVPQLLDHRTQAQVVRPEVMAPLRHAMRLVDDEQADRDLAQPVDDLGPRQLLGGEEDVGGAALVHDVPGVLRLLDALHRVDHYGIRRARFARPLDDAGALVALQSHQWRDDERRPVLQHRGHLVDRRLARPGRQHRQHVAPGRDGLHRPQLLGAQLVPSEGLGRDLLQIPTPFRLAHRDHLPSGRRRHAHHTDGGGSSAGERGMSVP